MLLQVDKFVAKPRQRKNCQGGNMDILTKAANLRLGIYFEQRIIQSRAALQWIFGAAFVRIHTFQNQLISLLSTMSFKF